MRAAALRRIEAMLKAGTRQGPRDFKRAFIFKREDTTGSVSCQIGVISVRNRGLSADTYRRNLHNPSVTFTEASPGKPSSALKIHSLSP